MTEQFELNAEIRTNKGTSVSRRMRHNGQVPAIIYGSNEDPQPITLSHKDIFHALEKEGFRSNIISLHLEGKAHKVIIRAVEHHVYKPKIMHVDFLRISAKEKITMKVPLHYLNEDSATGIKQGGILSKLQTEVEIRCLPADLPEFIELDIAELEIEHSFHLSDVKLPQGVELVGQLDTEHDAPIVSISKPKGSAADEEASQDSEQGTDEAKPGSDENKG